MKKFGFIVLVFAVTIYLFGCGKKQQTLEEMQQPMSMETLSTMSTTAAQAPEAKVEVKPVVPVAMETPAVSAAKLEPLPPSGPYKPTATEIQSALKNAGFYTGTVDGKLGPKTKKAISEFQKANNLTADGKVGPKTWNALSKYLNLAPAQ
jgi:peptidoglycan hydrolase-like protein with peptidoglycan-binding domain